MQEEEEEEDTLQQEEGAVGWHSEKGLSGLSQNKDFREMSRRKHTKSKLGILGGAIVSEFLGLNPLQSSPLKPFSQVPELPPPATGNRGHSERPHPQQSYLINSNRSYRM